MKKGVEMKVDNKEYERGYQDAQAGREYDPPPCNEGNFRSIRDYGDGYDAGEISIYGKQLP